MLRKILFAIGFVAAALPAIAQTSGESVSGFRLLPGQTYGSFTCPATNKDPCFAQYGSSVPVSGTFSASLAGFQPTAGSVANLSVTTTSSDVALPATTDAVVTNTGSNTAFFRITVGAGTAVTTDYALVAGAAAGIHLGSETHISAITSASTTTLQIQGGSGLATGYGGGSSAGGGSNASVSSTGSAVPGSATYIGAIVGGNLTGLAATANGLKVDGSAVTQPVSGTITAAQATASNLNATVVGTGTFSTQLTGATNNINNVSGTVSLPTGAATATNQTNVIGTVSAGTAAANSELTGCVYNSTEPSPTTGQGVANQCDSKGRQRQVIMDAAGNTRGANVTASNALVVDNSAVTQPVSAASLPLPTGASTSANQPTNSAIGGTTSGQTGNLSMGAVTTGSPTYTTAQTDPLSLDTAGNLRVNVVAGAAGGTSYSQGSTTSGQNVSPAGCAVTTSAPTYTTAQTNMISCGTDGGVRVEGGYAQGSTSSGQLLNPVGGRTLSTTPTDTTAQTNIPVLDLAGAAVTRPYALPDVLVSGTTAAMTGTTSTLLVAAPAGSLHNYITQIGCVNSHATVGTFVTVQDGSGGTALMTLAAAAVFGGETVTLPAPLRQPTAATALYVADVTTGANVICSATGYKGL